MEISCILFECVGVAICIWSGIKGLRKCLAHDEEAGVALAKGLALGLAFMSGGEVLRTVTCKDFHAIGIVAGVIVLRASLSILLHWEIKQEMKEKEEKS